MYYMDETCPVVHGAGCSIQGESQGSIQGQLQGQPQQCSTVMHDATVNTNINAKKINATASSSSPSQAAPPQVKERSSCCCGINVHDGLEPLPLDWDEST